MMFIMEYGSTPYIGMAPKKMADPMYVYKVICSKLCPRFTAFVDHTCHSRVFSSVTRLLALLKSTAEAPHQQVANRQIVYLVSQFLQQGYHDID